MELEAVRMLAGIGALEPRLALRAAGAVLDRIARRASVRGAVEDFLRGANEVRGGEPRWRTLVEIDEYTLQLFAWPVGARTVIHDHTSWGIYACLLGRLGEERYVRLDDGAQAGAAHLRRDWRRVWHAQEQSTLLPYAGGIHRVQNVGLAPAVSLHLYGPRLGEMDGRDYDAQRDRVCDRPPEPNLRMAA